MASKPYFDSVQVRSALLKLIEKAEREKANWLPEQAPSLYSFYRSSAPAGHQYLANLEFIESEEFATSYTRLEELLLKKIPKARSEKSLHKYSAEALEIAIALWEGFYVIEKVGNGRYAAKTQPITPDSQ
jgi:hypothetical protein